MGMFDGLWGEGKTLELRFACRKSVVPARLVERWKTFLDRAGDHSWERVLMGEVMVILDGDLHPYVRFHRFTSSGWGVNLDYELGTVGCRMRYRLHEGVHAGTGDVHTERDETTFRGLPDGVTVALASEWVRVTGIAEEQAEAIVAVAREIYNNVTPKVE